MRQLGTALPSNKTKRTCRYGKTAAGTISWYQRFVRVKPEAMVGASVASSPTMTCAGMVSHVDTTLNLKSSKDNNASMTNFMTHVRNSQVHSVSKAREPAFFGTVRQCGGRSSKTLTGWSAGQTKRTKRSNRGIYLGSKICKWRTKLRCLKVIYRSSVVRKNHKGSVSKSHLITLMLRSGLKPTTPQGDLPWFR